ncbi:unnamed protein product, partial [Nesidiocoris tenuis]
WRDTVGRGRRRRRPERGDDAAGFPPIVAGRRALSPFLVRPEQRALPEIEAEASCADAAVDRSAAARQTASTNQMQGGPSQIHGKGGENRLRLRASHHSGNTDNEMDAEEAGSRRRDSRAGIAGIGKRMAGFHSRGEHHQKSDRRLADRRHVRRRRRRTRRRLQEEIRRVESRRRPELAKRTGSERKGILQRNGLYIFRNDKSGKCTYQQLQYWCSY